MNSLKQFRYILEPLLKKYQWSKETTLLLFNEKSQQLEQEQKKYLDLKQAIVSLAKNNSCCYEKDGFIDIGARFNMIRYLKQQERLLQKQQDEVARIDAEVMQLREQLKQWHAKEKMLHNDKRKRKNNFLLNLHRQQLNEMDDLWNQRFKEVIL